jgi:gluconolactonase
MLSSFVPQVASLAKTGSLPAGPKSRKARCLCYVLLTLLLTFTATASDANTTPVDATDQVAEWFVGDTWIKFGGDYKGAEGTQWIVENDEPTFIYAAHHDFLVFKWSKSRGLRKWRDDSPEATSFRPNGKGGYYVVEQTTRRVTRWNAEAKAVEVLADRYQGKRLNRPNDLRVKSDGSLWFTDPAFMYGSKFPDQVKELEEENVYRLDPKSKKLTVVQGSLGKPNGIAFSPDEKWLYLTDSMKSLILRCPVDGDSLGKPETFVDLGFRGLDGISFDPAGNLWCGTRNGAYVYSPGKKLLGTVTFGEKVSSFAFHQRDDGKTLLGLTTKTAAHVATLQLPSASN